MVFISLIFVAISFTLICWLCLQLLNRLTRQYEHGLKEKAHVHLSEAFIFLDPVQLWSLSVALAVFALFLLWLLFDSWIVAFLMAIAFVFLPNFVLKWLTQKRLHSFDMQLPDFLLSLAGALRAGSGVQNAVRHIATDSLPPLSQELSLLIRQQRMGVSFEQGLDQLSVRMPSEACYLLVSALKIGGKSGGNLAEAIERIASTVRSRLQIQGRIKALTSQGKMQAWVMSILPIALMFVLNQLDPEAMAHLWQSYIGWCVLSVIFILEAIGIWMIKKIIAIDV